ncbi:FUSC family protein [Amycolatopsis sp. H20-H5]|uniref:FUSC family protein n=1 Tax=Amycolatopsis sp. H20-H5 TaxID=3046309 RepID=UPI002DB91447|nr:FUSC family protein [Amycolatopsis sp. H20-H5]MEC3977691.1 FUSC family protein [Amycolatopsis sp. H20-H5]
MKGPGLLVVVLVVLGGTAGLGFAAGLGNASVLAALTALFCLIAAVGGPLRSDLRLLAGFGPALVLAVGVPRLLGAVSRWAAIALLVVIVFLAGLLPALGSRYVTVGLGLGMASVFGYGFQLTGSASAGQILGAPAMAVVVVVLLRLLMGAKDPGKQTREALADALDSAKPDAQESAGRLWLADRPRRWTGRVLGGTLRYRAATGMLDARRRQLSGEDAAAVGELLGSAAEEATRLADAIRAHEAPSELEPVRRAEPGSLPGATGRLVTGLWDALEGIRDAVTNRDRTRVALPPKLGRELLRVDLEGLFSWRSTQLRHAIRCALGMALALVVAGLRPGDPLTVSFLMTTFAIMQPEWHDTLSKAWQRLAGSFGGAVVLALVIWLLPQGALLPIGLVALLGGFSVMQSKPMVFNGCMVLLSVGMNATTKHLDPRHVLVEYLLLMLLAAVIGLLFGFAAVPGVRKPGVPERFGTAVDAVRDLLVEVTSALRGASDRRELGRRFRTSARAQQGLLAAEPGTQDPTPEQREALDRAVEALRGLSVTASSLLLRRESGAALAEAVEEVARELYEDDGLDDDGMLTSPPETADEEQRLLLDTMAADVVAVQEAARTLR